MPAVTVVDRVAEHLKGHKVVNETLIKPDGTPLLIGDVKNRDVLIIDDEIDTGGSICEDVEVAKANGARDIHVVFIHPVLSSNAAERLSALPVKHFTTTNTIPIPDEKKKLFGRRLTILSIGPLLGEVIKRANEGSSVGAMFNE